MRAKQKKAVAKVSMVPKIKQLSRGAIRRVRLNDKSSRESPRATVVLYRKRTTGDVRLCRFSARYVAVARLFSFVHGSCVFF
jgi:hypothetical protein